jgi:DNA-binding GntR family transcriptional regulator
MPAPPVSLDAESLAAAKQADLESASPYQRIVADLRGAISCGALRAGDPLPTVEQLKNRYQVSAGTANRAIAELKAEGLVRASRGRRAIVSDGGHTSCADVLSLDSRRAAD